MNQNAVQTIQIKTIFKSKQYSNYCFPEKLAPPQPSGGIHFFQEIKDLQLKDVNKSLLNVIYKEVLLSFFEVS